MLKFPGVKPLLLAAAPGLGKPLALPAIVLPGIVLPGIVLPGIVLPGGRVAIDWLGTGLGVFRAAGLTGPPDIAPLDIALLDVAPLDVAPLELEESWTSVVALELGKFVGGLVPRSLSCEGFLDQGNISAPGIFQALQPVCEPASTASNRPERTQIGKRLCMAKLSSQSEP
jgi:hypothetical protein